MSDSLLPPNATASELALEASAAARLAGIPVPIRQVWNPDTCPLALLPWLAWAFSVDSWDASWSEAQQRSVVKNSILIHKHKGTIGAIRRALESIGYTWNIVEWFQEDPPAAHHTFRIEIGTTGVELTEARYDSIVQLVLDAKNVRSQLSQVTVSSDVFGNIYIGSAILSGSETDVWPWTLTEVESVCDIRTLMALINGETTYVIPDGSDPNYWADVTIWDGDVGAINPENYQLDGGGYPDGGVGEIDQGEYEIVGP